MTAAVITQLPPFGRWIVDTEFDAYDVDVDTGIAVWIDLASEAEGRHVEPEPFLFDTVECVVGHAMLFDVEDAPRATPIVVGITKAPADEVDALDVWAAKHIDEAAA